MREKRTFRTKMPTTQEAFADCVKEGKTAIVVNHSLIVSIDKELNDSKSNKEAKNALKGLGKFGLLLGFLDPFTWVYSAECFLCGDMLKDKIKSYDVYSGLDVNDESIIVLIHQKDYNPKLDTIKYDKTYVGNVKSYAQNGLQALAE